MLLPILMTGGPRVHIITVEVLGGSAGWDNSGTTFGSIFPGPNGPEFPNAPGEFLNTINTVFGGGADFSIICDTAFIPQDAFFEIHVQNSANVWRHFLSSAASYNTNNTSWTWPDGTDDVWDGGDNGIVRSVYLT